VSGLLCPQIKKTENVQKENRKLEHILLLFLKFAWRWTSRVCGPPSSANQAFLTLFRFLTPFKYKMILSFTEFLFMCVFLYVVLALCVGMAAFGLLGYRKGLDTVDSLISLAIGFGCSCLCGMLAVETGGNLYEYVTR
jgi:hypothetical protein